MTFLALLELLSLQKMKLVQGEGANNFWLTISEDEEDMPDVEHEDDTPKSVIREDYHLEEE